MNPDSAGLITIPARAFRTLPGTTDYKVATLRASVPVSRGAYVTAAFKIKITSPLSGVRVGYSNLGGNEDKYFAIANLKRCSSTVPCGQYYKYSIPFAMPCSLSDREATIKIFDGDNVVSSNAPGSIQYKKQFTVTLHDDTDDTTVTLKNRADAVSQLQKSSKLAELKYDLKKGHKYRFVLNNVYQNNVLQFGLPYDSINYNITCDSAQAKVESELDNDNDLKIIGQDYSFGFRYRNMTDLVGKVNWEWKVYKNNGGGKGFNATDGDEQIDTKSGRDTNVLKRDGSNTRTFSGIIDDINEGGEICASWLVTSADANTIVSPRRQPSIGCFYIGKRPAVQVYGGDIRSGLDVIGYPSRIEGQYYGSWGEYGVFSQKRAIRHFAAGGYWSTDTGRGNNNNNKFKLAFAHQRATPNSAGMFNESGSAGNTDTTTLVREYMKLSPVRQAISRDMTINATADAGTRKYMVVSNGKTVTVSGGEIGRGGSLVINNPEGTVRISGDIKYSDDFFGSASEVPQMVIIAKNIIIDEGVSRVDAWLIGSDTISTCGNAPSNTDYYFKGLTLDKCSKQLVINGPVVAGKVLLRRTAGGDGATAAERSRPAEKINYRGDAALWASQFNSNTIKTTYTSELPPRF